jgi:TatD DNase family protein
MIDSHCHLTYPQLFDQLSNVLGRAKGAGVTRMITIGTSISDARKAIELCKLHPHIRCAVGIHPHHSNESEAGDMAALREMAGEKVVLALGEMGLDYHYDFSPKAVQHRVFIEQLELARELGRAIVIHCREAIDDCLAMLKDFPAVPCLFHCFTGTLDEARRLIERGYLLGFTGVVTYNRSAELRDIAKLVPNNQFLVETDAPYLSPEPFRKQRVNEPARVVHTAAMVAKVRGIPLEEVDRMTTANTARFFNWPVEETEFPHGQAHGID